MDGVEAETERSRRDGSREESLGCLDKSLLSTSEISFAKRILFQAFCGCFRYPVRCSWQSTTR